MKKCLRSARIARLVILTGSLVFAVASQTALAGTIVYSWEGTIEVLDPNENPWDIPAGGAPFVITGIVDQQAVDLDEEINVARFPLLSVELFIDDNRAAPIGAGVISFREFATTDTIGIRLQDVTFRGISERFVTNADMLTSTFTLDESAEFPPEFGTTTTSTISGSQSGGSSYGTLVNAGVTVTSIPEPSTLVLILMALLGPTIFLWRSCTRRRAT